MFAPAVTDVDLKDCFFYHTMDLPGIGLVKGAWDLRGKFQEYTDHFDFSGKRVLDVGAGSGFLSFSAEKAGAREVVSFDMDDSSRQDFLPFANKLAFRDRDAFSAEHNKWIAQWRNAYWLSHRLLAAKSKVFYGDIYSIPMEIGQFDVSIVGSVLEHLSDPIKAIASVSRVTSDTMIIVTCMLDTDAKIAEFLGDSSKPENDFVFWSYSRAVYHHVLSMLNFRICSIKKHYFKAEWDGGRGHERYVISAKRQQPGAVIP